MAGADCVRVGLTLARVPYGAKGNEITIISHLLDRRVPGV